MTKTEIRKLAAGYPKFVEWSEPDQCFIGRCPMLFSGGVHGNNEVDVYRELCLVAEEWVEIFQKDGTPLPETKQSKDFSGKFMVRIAPELHERLVLKAMASGESLNSLVAKKLAKS